MKTRTPAFRYFIVFTLLISFAALSAFFIQSADNTASVSQAPIIAQTEKTYTTVPKARIDTSNRFVPIGAAGEQDKNISTDKPIAENKPSEAVENDEKLVSEKDKVSTQIVNWKLRQDFGVDISVDSDGDGINDFDEINIYGTDPGNPKTIPGEYTDGEKILLGIDPLSENLEGIVYEDPKVAYLDSNPNYELKKIDLVSLPKEKEVRGEAHKALFLSGIAPADSFVTIYIFSTPIVVTVKSGQDGNWEYVYEKELPDGDHTVFVATVNNSGKILGLGKSSMFVKTAEAAELITEGIPNSGDANKPVSFGIFMMVFVGIALVIFTGAIYGIGFMNKDIKSDESQNSI